MGLKDLSFAELKSSLEKIETKLIARNVFSEATTLSTLEIKNAAVFPAACQ